MADDSFDELISQGERPVTPDATVEDELLLRMLDRLAEPVQPAEKPVDTIIVLDGKRSIEPIRRRLPTLAVVAAGVLLLVGGWVIVDRAADDRSVTDTTPATTLAPPAPPNAATAAAMTDVCGQHHPSVSALDRDLPGPDDGVAPLAKMWIESLADASRELTAALEAHADVDLAATLDELEAIDRMLDRQASEIAADRTNRVPLEAPGIARRLLRVYEAIDAGGIVCTPQPEAKP